jgi:hypothetical protein
MMLVGANCYANVWGSGNMSGTASTLETGGEAMTGASSKAVASHQQGCDAFPFTNFTSVSLQLSTGNHLYPQGSAKTSTSCTCPDGQTYAVQSQCSKNAKGVDVRTNWYEDDHQKCTYGASAGTGTADTACGAVTNNLMTCASPKLDNAAFQHTCTLGDVKLPVNGGADRCGPFSCCCCPPFDRVNQ